jgi:hypothetical protein
VAQYGSSDSGASLGDILGEALKAKQDRYSSRRYKGRVRCGARPACARVASVRNGRFFVEPGQPAILPLRKTCCLTG